MKKDKKRHNLFLLSFLASIFISLNTFIKRRKEKEIKEFKYNKDNI